MRKIQDGGHVSIVMMFYCPDGNELLEHVKFGLETDYRR
jgi:hypothetical protein